MRAILEAAESYWPALDVVFAVRPCCGARDEMQLQPNTLWHGYVYAAGAPHFAGMDEYAAPGLSVRAGLDGLTFTLDSRAFHLPAV